MQHLSLVILGALAGSLVLADPEASDHGGRGGGGGFGGRGGDYGRRGGYGGHGGYGRGGWRGRGGWGGPGFPGFFPPPPPAFPLGPPLPLAPLAPLAGPGGSFGPQYIGPLLDDGGYGMEDYNPQIVDYSVVRTRNLNAMPQMMQAAPQANMFTAHASASVMGGGSQMMAQPQQEMMAQPSMFAAQSPRMMMGERSSNTVTSGRMFNQGQGTEGLGIEVEGQGQVPPPQSQPMPLPQAQPMPLPQAQPMPLPAPVVSGGLVTKGFSRKSESYNEQKSGNRSSVKEYEKTTVPV